MCGICGIFGEDAPAKIATMLDNIRHRGPDGTKTTTFPWGGLGFCRLHIFGPGGVNQPVESAEDNLSIIFNGEIYNFDDLAKLVVDMGPVLDEADLILKLYSRYGTDCFPMLQGMYAIAILTRDRVLLVRDPLGIKPLVYYISGRKIYFASEIKALLPIIDSPIDICKEALAETAVLGFLFDLEKTMFKGIHQVRPGSVFCFEDDRRECEDFYRPKKAFYSSEEPEYDRYLSEFEDVYRTATRLYLEHSSYPPAIYLSGGLDSSLMTLFMSTSSSNSPSTFTLYDDEESQDRIFAGRIARKLKTQHQEFFVDFEDCFRSLKHYLFHYESLVTDGIFNVLGSLAFHMLSEKISQTHKVAYCGEGADELFGGYKFLHTHPLGFGDRIRERSSQVNNGNTKINDYIQHAFPNNDANKDIMRKEIFDLLMGPGLTNCHLWSVDRSSSSYSFEARPLFLFDPLRDFALNVPINAKVSKRRRTKLILKKFAEQQGVDLFKKIANRRKLGMPAALKNSMAVLFSSNGKASGYFEGNKKDCPHLEYSSFIQTDFERHMFDVFFDLFVVNRGESSKNGF